MDGITAAEKIMTMMDAAVVFVTGHEERAILERAKNAGAHGFVLKPFLPGEIRAAVEIGLYRRDMALEMDRIQKSLEKEVETRTAYLQRTREQMAALLNTPTDSMALLDLDGTVLYANATTAKRFGMPVSEFVGSCAFDWMPKKLSGSRKAQMKSVIQSGKSRRFTDRRNGRIYDNTMYPVLNPHSRVIQIAVYGKDITSEVKSHERLKKNQKELEQKSALLEETNIALKVMLQKSTEQREEVETEVLSTLNRLVLPIISKMKRCHKIEDAQGHVKTLESSLKKMGSSFTRKLSILVTTLSPREIQVANLIRDGRNTREIARELQVKKGTVETYRNSIRKKLDIRNQKVRLKTYLQTLS